MTNLLAVRESVNTSAATGICKKQYPFKNRGSERTNPPSDSSKLKVYLRATCRSSEIKYPFCKGVIGRSIFSTLTKLGEGWRTLNPILERVLFSAKTGPKKKHKTEGAGAPLGLQFEGTLKRHLWPTAQRRPVKHAETENGRGVQDRDALYLPQRRQGPSSFKVISN